MQAAARNVEQSELDDYLNMLIDASPYKNLSELAHAAGVVVSILTRWRNGQTELTDQTLARLAPVLGCRAADLMIKSGRWTAEQLGTIGPAPHPAQPVRFAPALVKAQAFVKDPNMTRRETQFLLRWVANYVDMCNERVYGPPEDVIPTRSTR